MIEYEIAIVDLRKPRCRKAARERIFAADKQQARSKMRDRFSESHYRQGKIKRVLKKDKEQQET